MEVHMNIPIKYWQATEGQYSENSFDKPLYTNETNSAPDNCDYFTIAKEFEVDDKSHTVDEKTATAIANHLQFKGDVRESKSGKSWRVYKNRISNSFDLSAITS
tara:strand:- start:599 stop:910 length:312 start_codon:yes stop_codon:yes gene_type:complete